MGMITWLAGVSALIAEAAVRPAETSPRWALRDDPGSCVLERRSVVPPAILSIGTTPGSDSYRLAIAADKIGKAGSFVPASLTFAPSQRKIAGFASLAKLPTGKQSAIWMDGVAPSLLDELAVADTVTLSAKPDASASLPVPAAAKAIEALRRCNADQLIAWGADAAQFAPGGTMPVALKSRNDWLSNTELLKVAGQTRRSDLDAPFRVGISADGLVDTCLPVNAEIEGGVARIACAAVVGKRLFTPARDASGKAVRGAATFRVRLMLRPGRAG